MSGATPRRRFRRVIGSLGTAFLLVVVSTGVVWAMGTGSISGRVFVDPAANGLNDGPSGGAANPGAPSVRVRIFHDDGSTVGAPDATDTELAGSPLTTDPSGLFTLGGLGDGAYWVAVDSKTIDAVAWPDQTWGPTGSQTPLGTTVSPGHTYSGRTVAGSDGLGLLGPVSTAEHVALVTIVGGAALTGLDFGFSHNVVTTTAGGDTADHDADVNRTVQGSLRQFITNANTLAGANDMRFVPVTAANTTVATRSWHRITVSSPLPTLSGASTSIDGTVYSSANGSTVLDPNTGSIGTAADNPGFTVGVDAVALPVVARADLELVAASGTDHAFLVTGSDVEIRDLAVRGFDVAGVQLTGADRAVVSGTIVGVSPNSVVDPGAGSRNAIGIQIDGGVDGSITGNLLAHNGSAGINLPSSTAGWVISGNEVTSNGVELSWPDGIRIYGATSLTISENLIQSNEQNGIEILREVRALTVSNNTVDANGQGGGEVAGIRDLSFGAWPHSLVANVVTNNAGPGVIISRDGSTTLPPSLVTLSRNEMGGNGRLGIDITLSEVDRVWGDGPNPLGTACGPGTGSNVEINRPDITSALVSGSWIRLIGTGCASSTIEFFTATPDGDLSDTFGADSYGEPVAYLGSGTVATDGSFDVFLSTTPAVGTPITATVTDPAGNTSELAANESLATVNIPAISVVGSNPIDAEAGVAYTDGGATAFDVEDGDLTSSIVTVNPVDTNTLGSYAVTYDVTDSAGNPADQASRTVNVLDTIAPTLTLAGSASMTVEAGTSFTDPGATASDSFEGDLTSSVSVSGSVDTNTLGSHVLTYSVTDSSGNAAVDQIRTVTVTDTLAPVLVVLGDNPLIVPQLTTFVDPGATALDLFEGDLSPSIVVGGNVDTALRGTYQLSYDVSDSSGNASATVIRDVTVADANPPVITALGANPVSVEAGDGYVDAGALALDAEDGDITDRITVSNPVDQLVPGAYTVTYDVTDLSGNPASAVRAVTVVDTTPPDIQILGDNPLVVTINRTYVEASATAFDIVDGDLTSVMVVGPAPDTSTLGTTIVTYTVTDAAGNVGQAERTVEVVPNQPPIGRSDSYDVTQRESLVISGPGLLANDSDPDADLLAPTPQLRAVLEDGPAHGTVVVRGDGSFTYDHGGDAVDTDQFTYRVIDGDGAWDVATVTLDVAIVNRPPTPAADTLTLEEDGVGEVDVLANDRDPDGDPLILTAAGANPVLTVGHGGSSVTIAPVLDWSGSTSIFYTVSDGQFTRTGTINIIVTPVNDPPRAENDQITTTMGTPVTVRLLDNDHDVDSTSLALVGTGQPRHGSLSVDGEVVEYRPESPFIGTDWFDYQIVDDAGAVSTGRVTVIVTPLDLAVGVITSWTPPAGAADSVATAPVIDPPGNRALTSVVLVPLSVLVQAFFQDLIAFQVPLALLAVTSLWIIILGQWRAASSRRYAVVLLSREELLPAYREPSVDTGIVHEFASAARQIAASGQTRTVDGTTWLQVDTPDGRGWVDTGFLTEDAAKATFVEDIAETNALSRIASDLRKGKQPSSRRRLIDTAALRRLTEPTGLDPDDMRRLADAMADGASQVYIDRPAIPTSLRPNELRNFHWVTVAPATGPAWHILFEYHRGRPHVAGIRLEAVAVTA